MKKGEPMSKRTEWERIIEEQRKSGQSGASFCRERGVSDKLFSYWKRKLREDVGGGRTRFERVGAPTMIELTSPNGVSARVPADVSVTQLQVIVEALSAQHS
jgi:transposase-like protein